mgnify:CR=1 FL=1
MKLHFLTVVCGVHASTCGLGFFLNHTRQTITSEKKTKKCSHELNNIHPMGPQRKIQSTSTRKTNILNTTGAKRPPCSLARSIMRCWITPSGLSSLKRTRTILSRSCISKECRALTHTSVLYKHVTHTYTQMFGSNLTTRALGFQMFLCHLFSPTQL